MSPYAVRLVKRRQALIASAADVVVSSSAVGTVNSISSAISQSKSRESRKQLRATSIVILRAASMMTQRRRGNLDVSDAGQTSEFLAQAARFGLRGVFMSTAGALFTGFARATSLVVGSVFQMFTRASMLVLRLAATSPVGLASMGLLTAAVGAYYGYKKYREHKIIDVPDTPTYVEPDSVKLTERAPISAPPLPPQKRPDDFKNPVQRIIAEAAVRNGVPIDLAMRIGGAESSLSATAANKLSSAKGLFQFTNSTWREMGGAPGMQYDAYANADLGTKYLKKNYDFLAKHIGREVTYSDVYASHFLGPGVVRMLRSAKPDMPIEEGLRFIRNSDDYVALVMKQNPFLKGKTVGQLYAWFNKKVGTETFNAGAAVSQQVPPVAAAPASAPAAAPAEDTSPTGKFMLPTSGRFSSGFGIRTHPISGAQKKHQGIDIAAPLGTPIYAADGGVVTRSDALVRGYGTLVVIDHGNGFNTRYGHSRKLFVKKNQRVRKGQKIAEVGNEGGSTGPHLHFEVRVGNASIDPAHVLPGIPSAPGKNARISESTVIASMNAQAVEYVRLNNGVVVALN